MSLRILERSQVDASKWDAFVLSHGDEHVFSTCCYLDELAEQWCVLVDDEYTKGMAIPFTIRMGIKQIYTPIFCRSVFVSPDLDPQAIKTLLLRHFPLCDITTHSPVGNPTARAYQQLEGPSDFKLNEQAKRMLKKFSKSGCEIVRKNEIPAEVFTLMKAELEAKGVQINSKTHAKFKSLLLRLRKDESLDFYAVYSGDNFHGGAFFLSAGKSMFYLKSGVTRLAKEHGAMYAVMNQVIPIALEDGGRFDFVGSTVPGVRRFNVNFGAKDVDLHEISWNQAPFWFNALRSLKKQFAKRS